MKPTAFRPRTLADALSVEARVLRRDLRWWFVGAALIWIVVLRLQEPPFARTAGMRFFWDGVETTLLIGLVLIPAFGRSNPWLRRGAIAPAAVSSRALTILLCGSLAAVVFVSCAGALDFTVTRDLGPEPLRLLAHGLVVSTSVAALSPAVAVCADSVVGRGIAWTAVVGASLELGVPIPTLGTPWASGLPTPVTEWAFAFLLGTLGSFVLSWGLVHARRVSRS